MDITKLPDKWRHENLLAGFTDNSDHADAMEAALPKWTRITDDPETWPDIQTAILVADIGGNKIQAVLICRNNMVRRMVFFDCEYTHWRPLTDLDYPPCKN